MKKYFVLFWFIFWILYLEIVYRIAIIGNFFNKNLLILISFSFIWIAIFSIISKMFSNKKINKILLVVFTSLTGLFTLAQIVYFNFYNSIFSFFSLTTGTGQVMQFWEIIIDVILRIWYIFVLILIPYILFLIYIRNKSFDKDIKIIKLIKSAILVLALLISFIFIMFDKKGMYFLKKLVFNTHAPMLTIEKTGLLTMQMIDVYRFIFGFEEKIIEDSKDIIIEVSALDDYNVLDIDFDKLIKNEKNNKVVSMHNYFKNVKPTQKNKYSGLLKNKNIILITAEAFDTIAIDEKLTPTLYKMSNNSFIFNNFYQPLYPISTSDGEYMNLTSLIPKEGVWSFYKTSKNKMPFGFGTVFKNMGYNSYAFHNHNYNYYDRDKSHKNLGFTYLGCGNGLQKEMNCNHWPNSDLEMINSTIKFYLNKDKPFATYYMTVSGHLNYNFGGNNMAYRNRKEVSNLKYSNANKAYIATQIELDKALNKLLIELEKSNKLKDTLIVIAPDHYPYGLTINQINEISKINRNDKFEKFHTTLIMYSPMFEKTQIDKVVGGIDILPTIYNLFDVKYDSRLLIGKDIFSNEEGLVIYSDRSWITDKGKYNSVTKKFIKTTNEDISQEYIDNINKIVYDKFSMSSLILDYNYYGKLGDLK